METHQKILKRLQKRIDNYFISANGAVPSNPKTWATVLQSNIARREIASGEMTESLLSEILIYAVKKSLMSGVMSRNPDIIEVDESEAIDMDKSMLRRAIIFTKHYVREKRAKRSFPKSPAKWLNVLRSEIIQNFPFAFPEYALGPIANKICRWYIKDCPYDESEKLYDSMPVAGSGSRSGFGGNGVGGDNDVVGLVSGFFNFLLLYGFLLIILFFFFYFLSLYGFFVNNFIKEETAIEENKRKSEKSLSDNIEKESETENQMPVLEEIDDDDLEKLVFYILKLNIKNYIKNP